MAFTCEMNSRRRKIEIDLKTTSHACALVDEWKTVSNNNWLDQEKIKQFYALKFFLHFDFNKIAHN